MNRADLENILQQASKLRIMVMGDFFLDNYLYIDPRKDEISKETGKVAHQVVGRRSTPGAAGNVASNLRALGVERVLAVGVLGLDGHGYELKQALTVLGVDTTYLLESWERVTPTYVKPMRGVVGKEAGWGDAEELNRLDLKNWTPTPLELEEQLVDILKSQGPQCDAIIVVDQVEEANCGVITEKVRRVLKELGTEYPELIIFVDSRKHIDRFSQVILKPNEFEAGKALGMETAAHDPEFSAKALFAKTGKPVFLTCGEKGQWVCDGDKVWHVPAVKVEGPIDIVGAGDSTSAGTVVALAAGASYQDAAFLGNLVASVTIRKIGTTGSANPQEVLDVLGPGPHTIRRISY